MNRPPRPAHEPILTRQRLVRILLTSAVMAAGTMGFVTFVFFQIFNLLNVRHDTRTIFSRETLANHTAFIATISVIALLTLIVETDALHGFFTTTDLALGQWLACAAVGTSILMVGELVKAIIRTRDRRRPLPAEQGNPAQTTAV